MSDISLDGANKASQAAAMDALNLDDLFLGGGDNDEEPLADSLFADMDIDLGDIMDGIIGDSGENMSVVASEEFGGIGGVAGATADEDGGGSPLSAAGPVDVAPDIDAPPFGDEVGSGKGKAKARTARSNPHLAIAQQQQQQQQQQSKPKQQLAVSTAGSSKPDPSPSQILSPTTKRRRRKNKKWEMGEDDDAALNNDSAGAAAYAASVNAKKGSGGRRSGGGGSRSNAQMKITASTTLDSIFLSHSSIQSTATLNQSSAAVATEAKTAQQQQQEASSDLQTSSIQSKDQESQPAPPASGTDAEREREKLKSRQILLRQEQESISKFGLDPSRTLFFPYMQLPPAVEVKKRGLKMYPCLEKLNSQSDVRVRQQPQQPSSESSEKNDDDDAGAISTTSPIYELFDTHLGVLTDSHGNQRPPNSLRSSLSTSIRHTSSLLKKKKKQHHPPSSSSRQATALVEELSRLYAGCMKQSAFLRQNMWNMESWCDDHLSEEDFGSVFDVRRKEVEWVLRMMQQMKQRRLDQQRQQKMQQQQQEQLLLQQQKQQQQLRLSQHQKQQQQQQQHFKKILAPNSTCLPFPETMPSAPTHGGRHSTPVISVRVRVRVAGWRDKSGSRLTARLWSPAGWKAAMRRGVGAVAALAAAEHGDPATAMTIEGGGGGTAASANNATTAATSISNKGGQVAAAAVVTTAPALDVSSVVSKATLETVALELVRPDLMPKNSSSSPPNSSSSSFSAVAKTALTTATATTTKSSAPATASTGGSGDSVNVPEDKKGDKKEEKKKTTRKRKVKDGSGGASSTMATVGASSATASSKSSVASSGRPYKRQQLLIPHVPGYDRPRFHRPAAILAPYAAASASKSTSPASAAKKKKDDNNNNDNSDPHQQRSRLLQSLHIQILHPSISPTERRSLLANKVSASLARLQRAHQESQSPITANVRKQLEELQSVYCEDLDIVPEHCNTIGLWNWMKGNNYFDELDTPEDVHGGLFGCWQPELDERQSRLEEEGKDGCHWGGLWPLPPPDNKVVVKEEEEDGIVAKNASKNAEESSPLFDRLQSLLVEVDDGSSGDDDIDEDDDDYLLSDLPDFSPEEFMHGPNGRTMPVAAIDEHFPDDATMDVSALTLDQRTYVQLRVAGLADAMTPPHDDTPPSSPTSKTRTSKAKTDGASGEPVDAVLSRMKSRLSALHAATGPEAARLRSRALSHVADAPRRRRREADDAAILSRYRQLQIKQRESMMKEEEEENQRQIRIRTSGRVKVGSNKFDGEQWLPW